MFLYGSFINNRGEKITVNILTNKDRSKSLEIGGSEKRVFFTGDPVEITGEINNTFDHLIRHSATIHLLAAEFMPDLFQTNARDSVVNIFRNDVCIFAGFLEPQVYSQQYNARYDELELSCIDALSALQYSSYKDVSSKTDYATIKPQAQQRTFYDILLSILEGVCTNLDISGISSPRFLFDGSKRMSADTTSPDVFRGISIYELLFLGEKETDVWKQQAVVEEIMRYLNLHIMQVGFDFYIFSWRMFSAGIAFSWQNLKTGEAVAAAHKDVEISINNVTDSDTSISVGEVYNKVSITCKIEARESVVEAPLEESALEDYYPRFQKYCTEISSDGQGNRAIDAFYNMTHDKVTTFEGASITDWFVRVKKSKNWVFPAGWDQTDDLVEDFCKDGKNQQALPNHLGTAGGAAIISIGSLEKNMSQTDNTPPAKVPMTDYMVFAVNGNGKDKEDEASPTSEILKAQIPRALYNGNAAGGVFSPADDDTTNYIVFSGKIILNPLMRMSAPFHECAQKDWKNIHFYDEVGDHLRKTVYSKTNKDGRYYTRKYWQAKTPLDEVVVAPMSYGLVPFSNKGQELFDFTYSAAGDATDKISKVAVLACMLIIGDKCVVESGKQGQIGDFEWRKYKPLSECANEDEYYQQCFYIGFDPKIGDKLIGKEYDIQNNIFYTFGIDAEGTAIPIRKADKVSGAVKFMILGPVNTIWDGVTRRHPTFFRHTKWGVKSVPLLAHVSNILLKSFEIKTYSDNGRMDNVANNDVIYTSDTREEFSNGKDIEFKITSALTAEECKRLNVRNTINISTPTNEVTGEALLTIYDTLFAETAKPEQLYVNAYYMEYHMPRITLSQRLTDTVDAVGYFYKYRHPALDKPLFVQSISHNLMHGEAALLLKTAAMLDD